jgi:hypothetical protein
MNYEITLTLNEFLKILDDSKYDLKTLKVKNVSAISLTQAFEKKMQEIEKVNVKLQGRIGRFHLEPVRGVTPHFIAHGCCKKCSVKYKFIVKKKPADTERYVNVQIHSSGPHEHDENEKNKQIRGEERERIAKEILIDAGGSCRNYYLQKLELGESPPNEATLRKIKSEFLNCTEITTHDWINELISLTTTLKATLEAEKLLGYIQQITIYRDFSMYLYTEMQLQCLKCLPYKRRILHIDNMDSLVSIPKRFRNQSTILNYFLLLKDAHDLFNIQQYDDTKMLMLSELSSSRYDIYGMTSYLKLLKADYEYLYQLDEDKFSYRLIIIEYSWNMISSCLEVFNLENLETYAQRVFNYSQGIDYEDMSKSWIYVCSTHTMNKFCKSISKIIDSDYIRLFACFCFSLLLNSYDLSTCSQNFELICHVFLSRYSTQLSNSSFNKLQAAIHVRPLIKDEVIKLLNGTDIIIDNNKGNKGVKLNGELIGQQQLASNDEYLTSDENEILNFKQIQDQMPFTLHFQTIFEKCFNIVKFESEKQTNYDQNVYYCPQFIQLLIDHYLPYSFLWAGFVLRDIYNPGTSSQQQPQNNFNVTRLTNSCVRKYSANKKQKGLENVLCLPDKYASDAYKTIKTNCIEFLQQIGSAESDLVRIKISSQLKLNDSTLQLLNGADLSASSANDLDLLDNSVLQTPATITINQSDNNNTMVDGTSITVASAVDIINEEEKIMISKSTPIKRKAASGKYKSPIKSKKLSWPQNKNKKNKLSSPNKVDVVDIIVENQQQQTLSPVATSSTTIQQASVTTTLNSDEVGKSKDAQQYIEFIVKGIKITNQNIMDLLEGHSTSDNVGKKYFF